MSKFLLSLKNREFHSIGYCYFSLFRRIVYFVEKSEDLNSKNFDVCQEIIEIFITPKNRICRIPLNFHYFV